MAERNVDSVARDLQKVGHDWERSCQTQDSYAVAIARYVLRCERRAAREALEAAAKECERLFLDEFGKTHEPIACAEAIRRLAAQEGSDADE